MDKKAVFINTASQVVVRFITLAFTLISIKLLTNYLGTHGIGEFNTITTYINFFIVIADLGLFSVTVREISKNPKNENKIISNVFFIRLISALIATVMAIALVFLTGYDINIKLGVVIATGFLFFNLLASVYDMILQYRLKMQYSATAEFLSKLIALAALIIIIQLRGNFLWVVTTIAITGLSIFFFKYLFARKYVKISPRFDKGLSSWIFNMAWPLGIVFIVNNLFIKIDTLLLFAIKGATSVGIYSISYKVLEVTVFIGSYFSSALKPSISENISKDKPKVASIVEKSIFIMIFSAIPITISCVIFSKEIILFLSNSDFVSGGIALIILAFALPLIYLVTLFAEILIANDERKLLIKISVSILTLNIVLNLILIPIFSFVGAAITTLTSQFVLFLVYLIYARRVVKFGANLTRISKLLAVGVLTATIGYLISLTSLYFLVSIAIIAIIYGLLNHYLEIVNFKQIKELVSSDKT